MERKKSWESAPRGDFCLGASFPRLSPHPQLRDENGDMPSHLCPNLLNTQNPFLLHWWHHPAKVMQCWGLLPLLSVRWSECVCSCVCRPACIPCSSGTSEWLWPRSRWRQACNCLLPAHPAAELSCSIYLANYCAHSWALQCPVNICQRQDCMNEQQVRLAESLWACLVSVSPSPCPLSHHLFYFFNIFWLSPLPSILPRDSILDIHSTSSTYF